MNAPRYERFTRPRPTQTVWPTSRRPDVSVAPARPADPAPDDKREPEQPEQEPGYGHGV